MHHHLCFREKPKHGGWEEYNFFSRSKTNFCQILCFLLVQHFVQKIKPLLA